MSQKTKISSRDRDAILRSLKAGVVPRRGQHLIQVGRVKEVEALVRDIDRVRDGASTIRFVIGEYGSGKTFFVQLVRSVALQKRMVTVHGDLTPVRRLHATGGQARALYAELMHNLSTRTKPEGGALPAVVERFVTSSLAEAKKDGVAPDTVIQRRLEHLAELPGGYDFAAVVGAYWHGHDQGNDDLKTAAVRWLRAEYSTKTDARRDLGVRAIIDDATTYEHLKLMARFVRLAGYEGLIVCLDELVNLYKLSNTRARSSNYERLLGILNDSLQGSEIGMGTLLCGTPESLTDTRKGIYSYEALRSRLAENPHAVDGLIDMTSPVIRLAGLSPEDLYVLLRKLRHVHAGGDPEKYLVPDEALTAFMEHCSDRIGEAYFRTPRSTIREFVNLLAVLEQNPETSWQERLGHVEIAPESNPDLLPLEESDEDLPTDPGDDELASFQL